MKDYYYMINYIKELNNNILVFLCSDTHNSYECILDINLTDYVKDVNSITSEELSYLTILFNGKYLKQLQYVIGEIKEGIKSIRLANNPDNRQCTVCIDLKEGTIESYCIHI